MVHLQLVIISSIRANYIRNQATRHQPQSCISGWEIIWLCSCSRDLSRSAAINM
ncbi:hypothetical protein [Nostoc sp. 106C]|uniref:hypothetical protein n=1 Tax=Nostoc sp. 106C TaxID=1932667 RepID=UPI001FB68788|nr:hypothetical protein [Nostoc sp. 106C]